MLRDRWAGNSTIKSSVHQRLRHKECREVKLKTYWGTKKIPAHERSTLQASSGPFLLRYLQSLTLVVYVGGWLQLFQQSLSRAIITNDSVSGRELSPWQIDSKTQSTVRWRAEAVLLLKWEKRKGWDVKLDEDIKITLYRAAAGSHGEGSMCIQGYPLIQSWVC